MDTYLNGIFQPAFALTPYTQSPSFFAHYSFPSFNVQSSILVSNKQAHSLTFQADLNVFLSLLCAVLRAILVSWFCLCFQSNLCWLSGSPLELASTEPLRTAGISWIAHHNHRCFFPRGMCFSSSLIPESWQHCSGDISKQRRCISMCSCASTFVSPCHQVVETRLKYLSVIQSHTL